MIHHSLVVEIKDKCIPICCLANKKDINGALSEVEVHTHILHLFAHSDANVGC